MASLVTAENEDLLPCIVEILPGEYDVIKVSWVGVCDRVLMGVPSPVAPVLSQYLETHPHLATLQIEPTHEGDFAIYKTELFVVRPIQNHVFVHTVYCL